MSVVVLYPSLLIQVDGSMQTMNGQTIESGNLGFLSDGRSDTGVEFQSNNSRIAFVPDILRTSQIVTSIELQVDLVSGTKTTLTLKGSNNPEAEVEDFHLLGTYQGGPANGISFVLNNTTDLSSLRLSLESSTGEFEMSEVAIRVVLKDPGKILLNEGKIILGKGKIIL